MQVAFIGLGVMGLPIATHLVKAGHRVVGYARQAATIAAATERGIELRGSVADAVRDAEAVITMLTDGDAVIAVALAPDGVLASIAEHALYVDLTTIAPSEWAQVHDAFAARGIDAVDAPVSGGERGAIEGTLSVMAGGTEPAVERAAQLLDSVGTVTRIGPAGSGQVVKAANQLVVAGTIQLVSEALVLLERGGVDPGRGLEVIGRGLAGSAVIERKRTAFLEQDYSPSFRLALHAKDLAIVAATANAGRLSLPLTAAVTQLVNAGVARGYGDEDHAVLYRTARETNGLAL